MIKGWMDMSFAEFEVPRAQRKKQEFDVVINYTDSISKIAKFEVQELERITRYADNVEIPLVSEFERYLLTLLYIRIKDTRNEMGMDTVNNNKVVVPAVADERSFRTVKKALRVPARWYTLLVNIGEAHDFNRNFKFLPLLGFDVDTLMTKQELLEFSELLDVRVLDGYSAIKGLPKDPEGSLELMAMTLIQDAMHSMDTVSPVYGFLAYLVEMENTRIDMANRAFVFPKEYSSKDTYEANFRDYFGQVSQSNSAPKTRVSQDDEVVERGPSQPAPGNPPPNLGHNGNGFGNQL